MKKFVAGLLRCWFYFTAAIDLVGLAMRCAAILLTISAISVTIYKIVLWSSLPFCQMPTTFAADLAKGEIPQETLLRLGYRNAEDFITSSPGCCGLYEYENISKATLALSYFIPVETAVIFIDYLDVEAPDRAELGQPVHLVRYTTMIGVSQCGKRTSELRDSEYLKQSGPISEEQIKRIRLRHPSWKLILPIKAEERRNSL